MARSSHRGSHQFVGEVFVRLIASFLLLPRLVLDPDDDGAVRALFRECVVLGLAPRSPGGPSRRDA